MYRLYELKVGKFQADRILFVGMTGQNHKGGIHPPIGLGLKGKSKLIQITNSENLNPNSFCLIVLLFDKNNFVIIDYCCCQTRVKKWEVFISSGTPQ